MAQRRMSRKSFRKSRGRKTRSMRKKTMGGEETVSQTVAEAKTQIGKELYSGAVADLMTLTGAKYFSNKCSGETTCEDKKAKSYAEAHHIMGYIEPHLPEGYYEPRHEQARQEFLVKSKKHANLAGVDENKYVNEVNNEIKGLFPQATEPESSGGRKTRRRKSRRR